MGDSEPDQASQRSWLEAGRGCGRPETALRRWLRTRSAVLAAGLCLLSVAGAGGRVHWLLELASHFVPHYAVALLCALPWLCWLRAGVLIAGACGVCLTVQVVALWAWLPFASPADDAGAATGRSVRALLANVFTRNRDHDAVRALVCAEDPDLVVLQEVDATWLAALAPLAARYPHRVEEPRPDNFGIAVWSRLPLLDARIERLDATGVPTVAARVQVDGATFRLYASHPLPPWGPGRARLRDAALAGLARAAAAQVIPVVVLGDLNCTPWSPRFADLLREGRLRDPSRGRGLWPSWPAMLGPFGIPLDHCLVSAGVRMRAWRRGPRVGSDHLPLLVEFSLLPGC